ncbi:hypothetical protein LF1_23880 [Rubripirellula obstinata]|uniref:Uncharacterized protein n=1 Tax=Rubripirellula obstinata TaxID=406547 RepID=A0A5B1CHZ7_9BACT|nr:hypothetical protein LF1_23880 [Rubripirellula obstinata]
MGFTGPKLFTALGIAPRVQSIAESKHRGTRGPMGTRLNDPVRVSRIALIVASLHFQGYFAADWIGDNPAVTLLGCGDLFATGEYAAGAFACWQIDVRRDSFG